MCTGSMVNFNHERFASRVGAHFLKRAPQSQNHRPPPIVEIDIITGHDPPVKNGLASTERLTLCD